MTKALLVGLLLFLQTTVCLAGDTFTGKIRVLMAEPTDYVYVVLEDVQTVSGPALSCFYGIIYLAPKNGERSNPSMVSVALMLYATGTRVYINVENNGNNSGNCEAVQLGVSPGI